MIHYIRRPRSSAGFSALILVLLASLFLSACGGGGGGGGGGAAVVPVSVSISPATASVVTGGTIPLAVTVTGTTNLAVTMTVNGVAGGNASVGTITPTGVYTAPVTVPVPAAVTVVATSVADPTKSASATITVTALALGGPGGGYAGSFVSTTGAMASARANHTATLLATGRVLVAGGLGSSGAAIAATELYRPNFSNFSTASPMASPRAYQSATLLPNGKVLIAGGFDNSNTCLASAELYDPATATFSSTGSMGSVRAYHTATLLLNGKVLIAGGNAVSDLTAGTPLASAELYDPATGTFTPAGSMKDRRYYHTATLLHDGKVLVAGGNGLVGAKLATAELYDPATNTFTSTGNLANTRWLQAAVLLPSGSVLLTGGDQGAVAGVPNYLASAEVYDPAAATFSDLAPTTMNFSRGHLAASLLADGKVLVSGGIGFDVLLTGVLSDFLQSAEIYDPVAKTFTSTGDLPSLRANHTSTMLPSSGRVLIVGGNNGGTFLNSAALFQ